MSSPAPDAPTPAAVDDAGPVGDWAPPAVARVRDFAFNPEKDRAMADPKRIIFTFDEKSLAGLKSLQKHFGAKSMAETVRKSLQLADLIRKQVDDGYREVLVRNPRSGRRKVLVGELVGSGSGDE